MIFASIMCWEVFDRVRVGAGDGLYREPHDHERQANIDGHSPFDALSPLDQRCPTARFEQLLQRRCSSL